MFCLHPKKRHYLLSLQSLPGAVSPPDQGIGKLLFYWWGFCGKLKSYELTRFMLRDKCKGRDLSFRKFMGRSRMMGTGMVVNIAAYEMKTSSEISNSRKEARAIYRKLVRCNTLLPHSGRTTHIPVTHLVHPHQEQYEPPTCSCNTGWQSVGCDPEWG